MNISFNSNRESRGRPEASEKCCQIKDLFCGMESFDLFNTMFVVISNSSSNEFRFCWNWRRRKLCQSLDALHTGINNITHKLSRYSPSHLIRIIMIFTTRNTRQNFYFRIHIVISKFTVDLFHSKYIETMRMEMNEKNEIKSKSRVKGSNWKWTFEMKHSYTYMKRTLFNAYQTKNIKQYRQVIENRLKWNTNWLKRFVEWLQFSREWN